MIRRVDCQVKIDVSSHVTNASVRIPNFPNGKILTAFHTVPDLDGTGPPTMTIHLTDDEGNIHYSKSSIAEIVGVVDRLGENGKAVAVYPGVDSSGTPGMMYKVFASETQTGDKVISSRFLIEV